MIPIGHRRELENAGFLSRSLQLPPLLLITGPDGIGKSVVSDWIVEQVGVTGFDHLRAGQLTVATAELIMSFARSRPLKKIKVASCELSHGNLRAWDRLLKLAEEPPPYFRLIARGELQFVPATLRSRAQVLRLYPLSDDELLQVLTERVGWTAERASAVVRMSGGSVAGARRAEALLEQLSTVEVYLKAVATGDVELCEAAIRSFRDEDGWAALELVRWWCAQAGGIFSSGLPIDQMAPEVRKLATDHVRVQKLFYAVCQPGRPRVVARAAMMEVSR